MTAEDAIESAPYVSKTDAEIAKLAWDIVGGTVFHSGYHIPPGEGHANALSIVFMPLIFCSDADRAWMEENKISICYEHLDKAGPRSVNGMPTFMSMRLLNEEDARRLHESVVSLHQLKKSMTGEGKPG